MSPPQVFESSTCCWPPGPDRSTVEVPGPERPACGRFCGTSVRWRPNSTTSGSVIQIESPWLEPTAPPFSPRFSPPRMRATCAPLNPAYTRRGVRVLPDAILEYGALMLVDGAATAAADAARRLGIPVIPVGTTGDGGDAFEPGAVRSESEVALVLHTSGTTSRSKIVPLTHANLCASARNIARALDLGSSDRYLNVMPWFHVHGLLAALATLRSGGAVICPAAFHAGMFLELASRPPPDLVQRGPVDTCGGRRSNHPARRRHDEPHAPLHPVRIGAPRPESDGSPRGPLRGAGDRVLRHDRSREPNHQQPASARAPQARLGGPAGRSCRGDCRGHRTSDRRSRDW